MPPLTARGLAGLLAAFALMVFARASNLPLGVPPGKWPALVLAALLNVTAWMGLATMGLQYVGAGEGAMICYTMPAWTALVAWPVLGERPGPARLLALALGLGGIALLLLGPDVAMDTAKLPGVALLLTGAILFAFGTVLFKRRPLGLNAVSSVAWQVGIGCLPLALAATFLEDFDARAVSAEGWMAFLYMALLPLCLCYLTWFAALAALPAGVAAIGTLATPLIGTLSAAWMLGEAFGPRQAAALAMTMAGIVLAVRSTGPRARRAAPT